MGSEPERLITIKLEDGTSIRFSRTEEHDVLIDHGDHQVNLGKASAQKTIDLITLFESCGEIEEDPDG